jgi:hypothetical protein
MQQQAQCLSMLVHDSVLVVCACHSLAAVTHCKQRKKSCKPHHVVDQASEEATARQVSVVLLEVLAGWHCRKGHEQRKVSRHVSKANGSAPLHDYDY